MDEDVQLGESLLDELEGRSPRHFGTGQRLPEAEDAQHELGLADYAFFSVLAAVLVYFICRSMLNRFKSFRHAVVNRDSEDSLRRARMLQQAKFELETAQRREELARIEEERRKKKLDEMEAMAEGRSAKKPEKKKGPDARQFWDRTDGFTMGGGSSSARYTPTTRRRG